MYKPKQLIDSESKAPMLPEVEEQSQEAAQQHDAQPQLLNKMGADSLRHPTATGSALLQLQRYYGNRYVQRLVAGAKEDEGVAPETEAAINTKRGGGQALDNQVRTQMEPTFNSDFGAVRVHNDAQADRLSRSLNARAFTTGKDIFFREGAYSPGSSSGRELLAHELTHVVQQNGSRVQTKLTVGPPDDKYEQEADQMAQVVTRQERQMPQTAAPAELAQRQGDEEDQAQPKLENVQRQPEEEES